MSSIDLNCDLGEGAGQDAELMPLISSANIACGGHAGDEETMRATIELAQRHGVAIGAHPGYEDRVHFGRVEVPLSPAEVGRLVLTQTQRLLALAQQRGARLRHVKPHGALYNLAARDPAIAQAVADAVYEADSRLVLVGLSGSCAIDAAAACGLSVAHEVFADRTYQANGTLTPRHLPGAMIASAADAARQVLKVVKEGRVTAVDGSEVPLRADTICLHGDGAHAVEFARAIRGALEQAGVAIRA